MGGFVGEGIEYLDVRYFSLLDASSHMVGAMIGACVTDRFILKPIIEIGLDNTVSKLGVIAQFTF